MRELEFKQDELPWLDPNKKIVPSCIVLHWWGEPLNKRGVDFLIEILARRELSVQYAVLANGEIHQLAPTPDTFCRHAKCANESSIGIEIEGENAHDLDNNDVQFKAVTKLVKYLQQKYQIESPFKITGTTENIRFHGVASHKQVDVYCPDGSGKDDVHDSYVGAVTRATKS